MNRQSNLFQEVSPEIIQNIFDHVLQEKKIWHANLMDGGMFNTTYLVEYGNEHRKAVLRLGPINRHLITGFEQNLMNAEVYTYSICEKIGLPCSHVLTCDTTKTVIDRDFMIVEYIPSITMVNAELSQEQRQALYAQLGKYLWRLHQIKGESFGFVSRICAGITFERWSEALLYEVRDIARRLVKANGMCATEEAALLRCFFQSRELLDAIKEPHLLHTDLWAGNVLLDEKTFKIKAVIDSDRAMYGDVDFEFAAPWMEEPGIKVGYGPAMQGEISADRAKRRCLYRMFFCLLEAYVGHCEYNNPNMYKKRKDQLMELLQNHA